MKCLPAIISLVTLFGYSVPHCPAQVPEAAEPFADGPVERSIDRDLDPRENELVPPTGLSLSLATQFTLHPRTQLDLVTDARKFVVDSTASTEYEGPSSTVSEVESYAYTYYADGYGFKFQRRKSNDTLASQFSRRETRNEDSSFIERVSLRVPAGAVDLSSPPYDSTIVTETLTPRNGGYVSEYTIRNTRVDGSEPFPPSYFVWYDSVSTINDTAFAGTFSLDSATREIGTLLSHEKVLRNMEGSTLFRDEASFQLDTMYRHFTVENEYVGGGLAKQKWYFFSAFTEPPTVEYRDKTFSYPRENYRVESRAINSTRDSKSPYTVTLIYDYDELGSNTRVRTFLGADTSAVPLRIVEREYVGERGDRVLIREYTEDYSDEEQRLLPTSLFEIFGRFEGGGPVSVSDVASANVEPCRATLSSDAIQIQAPPGARLALVDVTGRITWRATVSGVSSGSNDFTTMGAPLPVPGSGMHVLTGRGAGWQCATKLLR